MKKLVGFVTIIMFLFSACTEELILEPPVLADPLLARYESDNLVILFEYNSKGELIQETVELSGDRWYTATNTFTPNGQLASSILLGESDDEKYEINYLYKDNQLVRIEEQRIDDLYAYDNLVYQNGRITAYDFFGEFSEEPIYSIKYAYENGNVISEERLIKDSTGQGQRISFITLEYDQKRNPLYELPLGQANVLSASYNSANNVTKSVDTDDYRTQEIVIEYTYGSQWPLKSESEISKGLRVYSETILYEYK